MGNVMTLRRGRKKENPKGKMVVISDTHFGDSSQLLDSSSLVDQLMEALASRGHISECILLGDVLDLWVKTRVPALKDARYFIESLSRLENLDRIVYVPGNHDHQVFMDGFRLEVDVKIMQGDLAIPRFMPSRHYENSIISGVADPDSKVEFSMAYPFIVREVNGKEVVLTHGHHLDFFDPDFGFARTFWLSKRIIKKRRKTATLHDIEMANLPFCGAMSMAPWVPELVEGGLRFYRLINFFARILRSRTMRRSILRDSLIRDNYDEIAGLLPLLGYSSPGCFVFGHTHRPGMGRLPDSHIAVANCGSWTTNEEDGYPNKTWLELDYDVKLYRLADNGPELMYSEGV
jgi:UDP-2,3-diacylglucosamine pyrophosphatase LpxH